MSRSRRKPAFRSIFVLFIAAAIPFVHEAAQCQTDQSSRENPQKIEDSHRARDEWFLLGRRLSDGSVGSGMRLKALQQSLEITQEQISQGLLPPASGIVPIGFSGPTSWTFIGPQPIKVPVNPYLAGSGPTNSGRVTAIAVNPLNNDVVYLGAASGGVWKSTDGGATWTPLTDFQPSLASGSLAVDPSSCTATDCSTIYVGTGEVYGSSIYFGAGVLKSTDGGATWVQQGANIFAPQGATDRASLIGAIAVDPFNNRIVLTGTSAGVYRSTDGGVNWTSLSPLLGRGTGLAFDSNNSGVVYAALGQSSGAAINGIYRSSDHGATWIKLSGTGANLFPATGVGYIALSVVPGAPGSPGNATLYAAIQQANLSSLRGVWKSTDSGANWIQLRNTPDFCYPLCGFATAIAADPANPAIVFAGGSFDAFSPEFIRSTDGGATWKQVGCQHPSGGSCTLGNNTVSLGTDYHALVFATDGSRLYMGNDQGAWRTENPDVADFTALQYTGLNSTLAITQQQEGHAVSPSDENVAFVGAQDVATARFSGSMAWDKVLPEGDGGQAAIDQQIPSVVYTTSLGSCQGMCIARSFFDGTSGATGAAKDETLRVSGFVQSMTDGINSSDRMYYPAPLTVDPNITGRVYFGTTRVYVTTDYAETWTPISPDLTGAGGVLTAIAVAGSDSNTVYVGTTLQGGSKVQKSTNALSNPGASWTDLTNPQILPTGRNVTAVAVDKNNSNLVYVSYSGFAFGTDTKGHVFRSPDGGATWVDTTGNLPNMPVNDVVADPDIADTLYIGTENGVWMTSNASLGAGVVWSRLGGMNTPGSLPNVVVLGLNLREPSRTLRASTHGRGTWILQLTNPQSATGLLLTSVHPASAAPGVSITGVTLDGANFTTVTQVQVDGSQTGVTTYPGSSNNITADFDASLLTPGVHQISLFDSSQAPNTSNQLVFDVYGPVPVLVSVSPSSIVSGGPSFTLTMTGRNFDCNGDALNSVIYFGSSPHAPEACGPSGTGDIQMTVTITSSEIANSGMVQVKVFNPPPGGGDSLKTSFLIAAPAKN